MVATIPVGLSGLALENPFRISFAKPIAAAAASLTVNELILLVGAKSAHGRRIAHQHESSAGSQGNVPIGACGRWVGFWWNYGERAASAGHT